ncbi:hypothetical protein, partial [Pseudomonas putida]|uniref:hypothetical protein n=1 Tax=Pseudomonas putida TaxID=303 RepID=UPI002B248E74
PPFHRYRSGDRSTTSTTWIKQLFEFQGVSRSDYAGSGAHYKGIQEGVKALFQITEHTCK